MLHAFSGLREECAALHAVFISEKYWRSYKNFCCSPPDTAHHRPIMWLAFRRGYIRNLTLPIHQFILEGVNVCSAVTRQYQGDLVEKWFNKSDHKERYESSRIFQGKLAELRFAFWLTQNEWEISYLEAKGGQFDVGATTSSKIKYDFEIKYLNEEQTSFDLTVKALSNCRGVSAGSLPIYSQLDYLLYRIYESAKKLKTSVNKKVSAIIISDYGQFDIQLRNHWVDWRDPKLLKKEGDIINSLDDFKKKYRDCENDLRSTLHSLDEIWILSDRDDLGLELKHRICNGKQIDSPAIPT